MADIGATLRDARRTSLVALATFLDVQNAVSKTKAELSNEIWSSIITLMDQVNAPPVSPIAPASGVGGVCWAGACVCELFAFVLSCFLLPLCGVKLARPSGCEACVCALCCALLFVCVFVFVFFFLAGGS